MNGSENSNQDSEPEVMGSSYESTAVVQEEEEDGEQQCVSLFYMYSKGG
jgi:hypothetical protein